MYIIPIRIIVVVMIIYTYIHIYIHIYICMYIRTLWVRYLDTHVPCIRADASQSQAGDSPVEAPPGHRVQQTLG